MTFCISPPYLRQFYNYLPNFAVRHRHVVLFSMEDFGGSFIDQFRNQLFLVFEICYKIFACVVSSSAIALRNLICNIDVFFTTSPTVFPGNSDRHSISFCTPLSRGFSCKTFNKSGGLICSEVKKSGSGVSKTDLIRRFLRLSVPAPQNH